METAERNNLQRNRYANLRIASICLLALALCRQNPAMAAAAIDDQSSDPAAGLECPIYEADDPQLEAERRQKIMQQIARARNFEVGDRKRPAQCRLSVSELLSLTGAVDPLLVDIRRQTDFREFHIPGSLNIPGKKIVTHRQWQQKNIVLINRGHSYSQIDRLCQEMRDAGFKQVHVLDGGIRAWQVAGRKLAGRSPADRATAEMPAQEFFAESAYAHWLLLMPEGKLPAELGNPGRHILTVRPEGENSLTTLKQGYGRFRQDIGADPIILVVADDVREREKLQDMALQVSSLAFNLEGGIANYHSHLNRQRVIWNHKPGIKRRKQCGG